VGRKFRRSSKDIGGTNKMHIVKDFYEEITDEDLKEESNTEKLRKKSIELAKLMKQLAEKCHF
jgi:hypothetical protein